MTTDNPKRRPPLSLADRLKLARIVETANPSTPDVDLADQAHKELGRPVSTQTVRDYRKALGLQPVKAPTRAELEAKVRELQAKLEGA